MIDLKQVRIENIVPEAAVKNVSIDVLRLDEVHPIVSGNKWFKLRYYLEEAREKKKTGILTFGGPWSNHILATAYACKQEGFHCTLFIRGEKPALFSQTLQKVEEWGAELIFLSRDEYNEKKRSKDPGDKNYLLIPEGGSGEAGVRGASTIIDQFTGKNYTHIACAAGTGTMAAGLLRRLNQEQELLVIPVLKGYAALEAEIRKMAGESSALLSVHHDFHFGGYAKATPALFVHMNAFYSRTGIPTDFVYTGKLFFALEQLLRDGHFPAGSRILAIHSGGSQGNASLEKGTLIF